MDNIKTNAVMLERTSTDELFKDQDDKVFYEIALTGRKFSDAFLITGNIKHYPFKTFVVTPRQMLDVIENNKH